MRLEVRCCCVPQKLVGWMDWPDRAVASGISMRFPLLPRNFGETLEEVTLSVEVLYTVEAGSYLAVKAEDVPLDQLRRLPGFMENTST